MLIIRNSHVDIDRKLNDQDQQDGQGDGLEDQQDDKEYRTYRKQVDPLQVYIGRVLKVFHHGSFADDQGSRVAGFDDFIDPGDLSVHLMGRRFILRYDKPHLMFFTLQHIPDIVRNHFLRKQRTHHGGHAHGEFDTVDLLHLLQDLTFHIPVQIPVQKDHMGGIHVECLLKLGISHIAEDIIRQGLRYVVVDTDIFAAVQCGCSHQQKYCHPDPVMADNEGTDAVQAGNDPLVRCLVDQTVKDQDHGREDGDTAENPDQDTL